MKLDKERIQGYGEYLIDGFRVNYLYGLYELCEKYVQDNFIILELGVNNGVSTELFCKYAKSVKAVDIHLTQDLREVLSRNKNLKFYQQNFIDFYKSNVEKFDLIYIDGSHTYEDIKTDIFNCLKFLKPGGFLCGHDYNSSCEDVIKAVNENFKNVEIFDDSSWLVKI